MGNVIGFAGRCYSGKSELAKFCTKYGYELKSFGTPLKQLIASLLNIKINEVNKLKNANLSIVISDMDMMFISKETDIPFKFIKDKLYNKIFHNTRQLLQVIGTDIIREYNKDWHVNKIKETLEDNKKYVFDDVRFENERDMIQELNGSCWFVSRPFMNKISNHISENSLKWQDFSNIIINDCPLELLKLNWESFMENGYESSLEKRENLIRDIIGNKNKINKLIELNNEKFNLLNVLFINEYEFTYKATYLNNKNIKGVEFNDNFVKVYLNDDTIDIVKHPLMIEDLKKYV